MNETEEHLHHCVVPLQLRLSFLAAALSLPLVVPLQAKKDLLRGGFSVLLCSSLHFTPSLSIGSFVL